MTRDDNMHPKAVQDAYRHGLTGTGIASRTLHTAAGAGVHVLEKGAGPPVVFLHGTLSPALFWLPVLDGLEDGRAMVPDRPGQGLSDAGHFPPDDLRAAALDWVGCLLDSLELPTATIVGHSMGGLWALWFALKHPERVQKMVLIGVPALPGTRAPLPFRAMATPLVGAAIARQRETPASVRRFARSVGEGSTILKHPELIDLMVATGQDRLAHTVARAEVRGIVSPAALLSRSGFREGAMISPAELRRCSVPTLIIWGRQDPVGPPAVAAQIAEMMPAAGAREVPGGHVPWLGNPTPVVAAVTDFVQRDESRKAH
ncbi:MAG: alpha/beta hydrolase [Ornithinimicrobium sp.]